MNPDELVTITNNQTKQIKQVKRRELPTYGLPSDYISQADTYAKSVMSGTSDVTQIPETYRAGALQALNSKSFTPKTKEEKDIEISKQKSRPAAEAVFSGIQNLKQQAEKADIGDVAMSMLTGGNYGTDAATFDQSRKLLGQTVAKLYEGGRLSDKDRDFYQNEILNVSSLGRKEAINAKLDNLSREILRASGYKPEDFGAKPEDPEAAVRSSLVTDVLRSGGLPAFNVFSMMTNPRENQFDKNVISDVGAIAKGAGNAILGAPRAYMDYQQGKIDERGIPASGNEILGDAAIALGKGTVNEYNELAGRPLEGGDIMGRIGKRAYEKPVTTALDLLPFISKAMPKGVDKIDDVHQVTRAVDKVDDVANTQKGVLPKIAEKTKSGAVNVLETTSGGGPKDLIAKNVMLDQAEDLNKTLLKKNILSSPTEKGRIINTQKALVDDGSALAKTFRNSKATITSDDILNGDNGIRDTIYKQFGASDEVKQAVDEVENVISGRGKYDLANNRSTFTMEDVWEMRKAGDQFKSKAYNLPNGPLMKDIADTVTGRLRDILSKKVPEATPILRSYGNLKTYLDDVLQSPQGVGGAANSSMIRSVVKPLERTVEYGAQKLYNMADDISPDPVTTLPVKPKTSTLPPIEASKGFTRRPLETSVVDDIMKKSSTKKPAQTARLIKDTGQTPTTRKAQESMLRQGAKKKYR